MNIACLAWGSLIWKPGSLPLQSEWKPDGPGLPVEFSRVGDGGELATAICMDAPCIPVYWALLTSKTLQDAVSALREREQIPASREDGVGILLPQRTQTGPLTHWAADKALDAIIWTALPPRFAGIEGYIPSLEEAITYLQTLTGEARSHARDYILQVPETLTTPYRQAICASLNWHNQT